MSSNIVPIKKCTRCEIIKTLESFYNDKHAVDGKCYQCKVCQKLHRSTPEYRAMDRRRQQTPEYKIYHKNYIKARGTTEGDAQKRRERDKRNSKDPFKRLKSCCSAKLRGLLKRKKNKRTVEYIGCTIEFLMKHLEKQFQLGMTWDNHGNGGWNIDHRMPIALAKDENDLLNYLHYSNLQPLWETPNRVKSDRIICPLLAINLS